MSQNWVNKSSDPDNESNQWLIGINIFNTTFIISPLPSVAYRVIKS